MAYSILNPHISHDVSAFLFCHDPPGYQPEWDWTGKYAAHLLRSDTNLMNLYHMVPVSSQ